MDGIKLRVYDGVAIAGFMTLSGLFYTGSGVVVEQSGSAAWMAVLSAHILMMFIFLITSFVMRRYDGADIIGVAASIAGRPVGVLYGIAISLYFCFTSGIFIREGAEILKSYGLRYTPVYVISGLILLAAVAMNFFGGKAIVKSIGFFFLFLLLGVVFITALGVNRYNPDYLFPLFGNGIPGISTSIRYTASMIDGVIILALFAPGFTDTGAMRKSGILALTVSAVLSSLFYVCLVMMFSVPIASKMISGYMEMGKSIYYNHFFYRFESVLLFFLIFSSAVLASLGLYIARKSAASAFGIRSHKVTAGICTVLVLSAAVIPKNLLDLTNKYLAVIRLHSVLFMAGVPVLLMIIIGIKRMFKFERQSK